MLAAKKKQLEIHNKLLFPNINKENGGQALPIPQTKVKIADLSHNLLNYENGNPIPSSNVAEASSGSLRIVDHHIRKQPTVKSNNTRKDGSPNMQMSPH